MFHEIAIALSEIWKCPTTCVNCNNMCYMSKSSENAKFSRVFDDSSSQKV
jgi:hypothetical protein